jgi:hypothetical protein
MALSVPQARAAMRDAIKPPPGNAMTLSVPQARNMLKEAIRKKYVGTTKICQRVLMVKGCSDLAPRIRIP